MMHRSISIALKLMAKLKIAPKNHFLSSCSWNWISVHRKLLLVLREASSLKTYTSTFPYSLWNLSGLVTYLAPSSMTITNFGGHPMVTMALVHSNWPKDAPICHTYVVSLTQMVQSSWPTYVYSFEPNYPELQHYNLAGRFHATYCTATYLWPRPSCQRGISQAICGMFWRHWLLPRWIAHYNWSCWSP